MMRRLRDEIDSADPALARAAALLASRPPLNTDRMWGRPLPPLEPSSHRRPVLRVALVLAISLASVVAGAATALPRGTWWAEPWTVVRALVGAGAGTETTRRGPGRAGSTGDTHVGPTSAPIAVAEPVGAPPSVPALAAPVSPRESMAPAAPAPVVGITPLAHAAPANRVVAPGRAAGDSARSGGDGESALMLDAVRALRRDRDPVRALALAESALDRYPHGAQVEEATALGMEAASAAGDGATARRLAERYLASFRSGRFTDRAQQIVSASQR
jgi:hypothetical protein